MNVIKNTLPTAKKLATQWRGLASASAAASAGAVHKLPELKYQYGELEPAISGQIMEIHHSKHHNTYVTNLNAALAQYAEAEKAGDITKQIALQGAIKFNGGGHINHSIFWTNLAPQGKGGGEGPNGELLKDIETTFGSFDNFKTSFSAQTAAVQGSGWGWLGYNKANGNLEIITKPNQDPLTEAVPLLGIDVWEHAYYLQYKNVRPDYLNAIWNVVNWENITERYNAAKN